MTVVKVIRLVGNSTKSWEDAAGQALREASKTVRDIVGIEATDFTALVQGERIGEYRCTVNIAFKIERSGGAAGTGEEGGRGRSSAGGAGIRGGSVGGGSRRGSGEGGTRRGR